MNMLIRNYNILVISDIKFCIRFLSKISLLQLNDNKKNIEFIKNIIIYDINSVSNFTL